MKYAFVGANRQEFHVTRMCQVLQVSRSGYYDWQVRKESERSRRDRCSAQRDPQDPPGDAKRLTERLRRGGAYEQSGTVCGKHRVARLRRAAGIEARRKRKVSIGLSVP